MNMKTPVFAAAALAAFCGFASGRICVTAGDAEVVLPADASPVERFAASEMTNFLSRAFGRAVPTVAAPTAGRKSIMLGRAAAERAGIDVGGLDRDEFVMKVSADGVIAIAGRDDPKKDPVREMVLGSSMRFERGTVFGVYDFLDRFVGCRFYFPGELGECVPRIDSFEVPSEWRFKPAFKVRRWYEGYNSRWFEGGENEPELRKRNNALNIMRLRMETEYVPCCHGQNGFRYVERFGKSHPEYFIKLSDGTRFNHPIGGSPISRFGQICFSSGAMEELYQDVKAYLTGQPPSSRGLKFWASNCVNNRYVDIMANDAFFPCECGKCRPRFDTDSSKQYATEMVWEETVKIAKRLTAEGVPGFVTQMAYYPYRTIPRLDIPTNVLVMVAERGPWAKSNPREIERERNEIRDWSRKLGRPVWIWTYVGKYAPQEFPDIPHYSPRSMAEFHKSVAPWIFGGFIESESDRFLYVHLNYYFFSRVALDPAMDVDAALDEYFRLMFGPAAGAMKEFFEGLEYRWVYRMMGNVADTNLGPVAVPPSEKDIWGDIYSAKTIAAWRSSLERGRDACAPGSLEGRRVQLFIDHFIAPMEAQASDYDELQAKIAALKFPSAAEPHEISLKPFGRKKGASFRTVVSTAVSVVRRDGRLVVTYDCEEPEMERTRCATLGHDQVDLWKSNGIEMFLNISGDRKSYYQIIVTEKGELLDMFDIQAGTGRNQPKMDISWESNAEVSTKRTPKGWMAEVSIPISSFRESVSDSFPANFCRSRVLTDDTFDNYTWSPYILGYHDPAAFGTVTPEK